MKSSSAVRVRFAPSPTGHLHLGGLRTTLFNWYFARHHNGAFLLRIEDTDFERSRQEYTDAILESLAWCGVVPDEPLVVQSSRIAEHRAVALKLLEEGAAYRCLCTKEELQERLGGNAADGSGYVLYDGKCRDRSLTEAASTAPYVIRFKLPDNVHEISFEDRIRGTVTYSLDQFDDFIIIRSDGMPTYNFAVVLDDAFMRISHVIRGEEHLVNTPRQIMLYQACGYSVPEFAHLPLILGPDGTKLSKRDAATAVVDYKRMGFLPDALCNYLVRLGWSHGDQEIFTKDELVRYFSLEQVGKKGSIFDVKKLEWMNNLYMKGCSAQDLLYIIDRDVMPGFSARLISWVPEQIYGIIELYKARVKTAKELADNLLALHEDSFVYDKPEGVAWWHAATADIFDMLEKELQDSSFAVKELELRVKSFCVARGCALPSVAQPIRFALTGSLNSPGVFELLSLLGKNESLRRIRCVSNILRTVT